MDFLKAIPGDIVERNALGLGDGDLVQVIILPIAKKSKTKEVKN